MAKYLKNSAGTLTEESSIGTSTGVTDSGKIPHLNSSGVLDSTIVNSTVASSGASSSGKLVSLDGTGRLDNTVLPVGLGADSASITASENLAAGDWINIWSSSGAKVRKADATTSGKHAMGFVLSAVSNGSPATVYFEGTNTQVTGQTPGDVFLSTTPGLGTSTCPSAAGQVAQAIGIATSATSVNFQYSRPIVLTAAL